MSIDGEVSGKMVETQKESIFRWIFRCRTRDQTHPASCWRVWDFKQVAAAAK